MRKFLIFIKVIQEVSNEKRHKAGLKRLGKGFFEARRVNPYNPLSYIVVVLSIIVGVFLFGFVGIFKEIDSTNPFKWH